MLYFIHRYDIYLLGVLLTANLVTVFFNYPDLFSTAIASGVLLIYISYWWYTRTIGCCWNTFHEDFRLQLEEAVNKTTPSDFIPAKYYDFLMPRICETLTPSRSLTQLEHVNTTVASSLESFIRVKSVTLKDNRIYLNFTIKYPKAKSVKIQAFGVLTTRALTGRPTVNVPTSKRRGTVPKVTVSLFLGTFNSDAVSLAKIYCLRSLNEEVSGIDTSIYPL